jgi:hypothetical protein
MVISVFDCQYHSINIPYSPHLPLALHYNFSSWQRFNKTLPSHCHTLRLIRGPENKHVLKYLYSTKCSCRLCGQPNRLCCSFLSKASNNKPTTDHHLLPRLFKCGNVPTLLTYIHTYSLYGAQSFLRS